MIFALVAAFDLDLRQRDAITTFLNSRLDKKETYTYILERSYAVLYTDYISHRDCSNEKQQVYYAANRVITYLYTTRNLAIKYSTGVASIGIDLVQFASDTSYGDHPNRRSSARYICQAYGGPVN
ncbi:hypothetical protein N7530_002760 [Penicillium desertorum]|uniref:Uncharacterized protein n=1 Tax=Penicillium desertorum TaxID=1303715 RepID=A0A9W9X5B5_9EURO|nr:hypothetical protein N7530_002760 [Penicillium desertorum]